MIKFLIFFILTFLVLASTNAKENIYLIENNEIYLENEGNILALRQSSKNIAFKNAFFILAKKILEPKDISKLQQIDNLNIENFVLDFILQDEKISETNYFAKVSVNFNPEKIRIFFSKINIKTKTHISENYLVLPIYKKFNTLYLWEDDNYWYDNLLAEYDKQGLLKLFFPKKSHINKFRISSSQVLDEDMNIVKQFLNYHKKKSAIILYLDEKYNHEKKKFESDLKFRLFNKNKFSDLNVLTEKIFTRESESSQVEMIAKLAINELQTWWKKRIEDLDDQLDVINSFYLSLKFNDLKKSLFVEKKIRSVLSSGEMILTELNKDYAVYKVASEYSLEQLNLVLESSEIRIEKNLSLENHNTVSY